MAIAEFLPKRAFVLSETIGLTSAAKLLARWSSTSSMAEKAFVPVHQESRRFIPARRRNKRWQNAQRTLSLSSTFVIIRL